MKIINSIEHRREELINIAIRLKRGQKAIHGREYKQPTVIEYIGWLDENILKLTEELKRERG